ncbi:MAG: Gfo/Idh/MocA family oxidoreductase [Rhodospirillaceae bacterium]
MSAASVKNAVVIGAGSIGSRHARILGEMGLAVSSVSRRGGDGAFTDLAAALRAVEADYVVVATETSDHAQQLEQLVALDFRGRVLVEKPLFAAPRPMPPHRFAALAIGYDLRFHPVVRRLSTQLAGERLISAAIYVGQYLPEWRPGRDYRTLYSARAAEGGGVLRDLSHELDLANLLLGPWRRVSALGGHWSDLEIDSDDTFLVLGEFARCPAATIQVNYLDRRSRRELVINTAAHTYHADLIAGTLACDRGPARQFPAGPDALYRDQHRSVLEDHPGPCTAAEAEAALALVAAAERAARDGVWVESL